MLTHMDYDENDQTRSDVVLPEQIDSISFHHDGGRITICVNGEDIYNSSFGTRDCSIEINRESMAESN